VNYRHAFHAGNFADVHKHVVLLALLERLKRKPTPLFFLDTHAGRGRYDLHSADATRGDEWRDGVGRLHGVDATSPDVRNYVLAAGLPKAQAEQPVRQYSGSPVLAIEALRSGDRAVFVEQQPIEARVLEQSLPRRRNTSVVCGDGYAALKTYLPPRENRGLVLIDPPYESEREFAEVDRAMNFGLRRWPNGMFAAWYPIKAGPDWQRLHAALKQSGLRKLLLLELNIRPADSPIGLNGSGLIVANPPWQFDVEMQAASQELHRMLAPEGSGGTRIEWLVEE
jgi:23S rRNA (adenine2030-N6)-methyltransferase